MFASASFLALTLTLAFPVPATPVAPAPAGVQALSADTLIVFVAPAGNRARYRVREQLASLDFPNDAVGETSAIQGQLVVFPDGSTDRARSRIVIDLTALESDSDRRDNFLRRNTLQTAEYPAATLIPTGFRGLPNPIPTSGDHTFTLLGDFVLKGQTFPTEWDVTATFANGAILGRATTVFTFEEVGLTQPRVASVLSVADDIRLEFEFRLTPERPAPE